MRRTRTERRVINAGVAAAIVIQGDPNRVALNISNASAVAVVLGLGTAPTATLGMLIPVGDKPYTFHIRDYGQAITMPVWLISAGAAVDIVAWEVLWDDDLIGRAADEIELQNIRSTKGKNG